MRKLVFIILSVVFCLNLFPEEKKIIVLCYHDVKDIVYAHYDPDMMAVSTENLVKQFSWFKGHNYHPVSLDDIVKYKEGKGDLPDNPVLLTFDDGLKSFYTRIFPILKMYNYPAVSALVGKWLIGGDDVKVNYAGRIFNRSEFMTWDEIREIDKSGLVEFASHTYDLHQGTIGNPQANMQPAASTRTYNKKTGKYENDKEYIKRIRDDLKKSSDLMYKKLGKRPRAIVWPYGKYNRMIEKVAASVGLNISVTLDSGFWNPQNIFRTKRELLYRNPSLDLFIWMIKRPNRYNDPLKLVHVDIDYLFDKDKKQQAKNFDKLVERVKNLSLQVVFLQAFSDLDGDGTAEALYFPNKYMKMRQDIFNRVAWQLKTRTGVEVYAWLPVSSFKLDEKFKPEYVKSLKPVKGDVKRLSIFNSKNRKIIREIYKDLTRYCDIDGILFHDDAYFNDYEDASESALKHYRKKWGIKKSILQIREDKGLLRKWTDLKSNFLTDFTKEIMNDTLQFRGSLYFARNIFARPVLSAESETWFSQSYRNFLDTYNYTAIMAMPYMEGAKEPLKWLENLVKTAKKEDPELKKTIFELQAMDWNTKKHISAETLLKQMDVLILNGALNFGYYPDDFILGLPELKEIRKGISTQSYPY